MNRWRLSEGVADQVAARLQGLILGGSVSNGQRFPSERELCELLGVSRTAVREAVRSLAAKGLLEVRQGGGTTVRNPTIAQASELMTLMLRRDGGDIFDRIHEVRALLEVEVAGVAAHRRDTRCVRQLESRLEATADMGLASHEWAVADVALHQAIAAATANPLYPILLASMTSMLTELRLTTATLADTRARAQRHHVAIVTAIVAHDQGAARREMVEHMQEAAGTFERARITCGLAVVSPPGREVFRAARPRR